MNFEFEAYLLCEKANARQSVNCNEGVSDCFELKKAVGLKRQKKGDLTLKSPFWIKSDSERLEHDLRDEPACGGTCDHKG